MIEPLRSEFNARFTPAKYAELLRLMTERTGSRMEFRLCETPCFFAPELLRSVVTAGAELTRHLLGNAGYLAASLAAVPERFRVPNDDAHPHFMTADFGLARDGAGALVPQLVELQAFPSLFGYQPVFSQAYIDAYDLSPQLAYRFSGMDDAGYWALLRETIVGRHDPDNVILAEIDPEAQKTLPDFRVYEQRLGVRTVDVAKLYKEGRKLFYRNDSGKIVPVHRIFNRVIVDELIRKRIELPFDYRDDLDVEWAGHPNWYFRISKFSIPFLDHPSVPPAVFLSDWFDGRAHALPDDRDEWILKPLYSFAGKGIQFAPSLVELEAIPVAERRHYLLQQRVHFENVIQTPEGPTQPEIRILYAWPDGGSLTAMCSLIRMGRGLMMGVDHNRDRTWVGSSAGLYRPDNRSIHA